MEIIHILGLILLSAFIVIFLAKFISKLVFKDNPLTTKFIARTAVFAAISIVLYTIPFLKFSLPIFPAFLEIHLDEIPAFIAGFAYGPLSGVLVIIVKTIVKLPLTSTAGVGELADLLYSLAFVFPAALIYKFHRNIKGALIGLLVATLIQLVTASFFTTFVMLDFYGKMFHLSRETIMKMCIAVNPAYKAMVHSAEVANDPYFLGFMLLISVPFNAIKDAIVVAITFLLYKRLRLLFKKIDAQKN